MEGTAFTFLHVKFVETLINFVNTFLSSGDCVQLPHILLLIKCCGIQAYLCEKVYQFAPSLCTRTSNS